MDLSTLAEPRPFLYHLTARENLARIRDTGMLHSAARLCVDAGRRELTPVRRPAHVRLIIGSSTVLLRDQAPLHAGNAGLAVGFAFADLVSLLNGRVYFWPGTASGPVPSGVRHAERYAGEHPAILRLRTRSLAAANPAAEPEYCRFNSGSPRWTSGRPSPRGPDTFVPAHRWPFTAGRIVEVTFAGGVVLPADAEVGDTVSGPWSRMFV